MKHQVTYIHSLDDLTTVTEGTILVVLVTVYLYFSETRCLFDRGVASSFMRKESLSSLPNVFVLRYTDF